MERSCLHFARLVNSSRESPCGVRDDSQSLASSINRSTVKWGQIGSEGSNLVFRRSKPEVHSHGTSRDYDPLFPKTASRARVYQWSTFRQSTRYLHSRAGVALSRYLASRGCPCPLNLTSISPLLLIPCILNLHNLHSMAIHPRLRPQASQGSLSPQQTMAISSWTEQASASLENLSLSDSRPASGVPEMTPTRTGLRGATVSLSIPLDDEPPVSPSPQAKVANPTAETRSIPTISFRRRESVRKDSMKRREALLKGKDGSRRRQRWENGGCLVPWSP